MYAMYTIYSAYIHIAVSAHKPRVLEKNAHMRARLTGIRSRHMLRTMLPNVMHVCVCVCLHAGFIFPCH